MSLLLLSVFIVLIIVLFILDNLSFKNILPDEYGIYLGLVIVGIALFASGIDFSYKFITYGEIHYSPRGIPIVVKDRLGAYLLSSGLAGIGIALIYYNSVTFYQKWRKRTKPPNNFKQPTE